MGLLITELPEIDKIYTDHIQALNDPKLRKEYQDLCFDLHLPCPSAYWTFETRIKDKLIESKRQPAGSWTRNFWNWMAMTQLSLNCNHASSFGAGYLTWKTTLGNVRGSTTDMLRVATSGDSPSYVVAGVGYKAAVVTTFGILVGTDATAFDIEQYAMLALIGNGTGVGQLSYQSMLTPTWSWTVGTLTFNFNWYRYMNNNTANTITVEEVGLVANTTVTDNYVLFERHVTGGLAVPTTAQLKCDYDMSLVYPS
jgi:hypothetical protein